MTLVDVDTETYYAAGRELCAAAESWWTVIDGQWAALAECGSMCGSYEEAITWAEEYDTKANELIDSVRQVAAAADAYGRVLMDLGYNHELGDYFATTEFGAALPAKPQMPSELVAVCRAPLPSAGGPGSGLSEAIGLASEVGITVPDGDTGKLANAANLWKNLSTNEAVTGFVAEHHRIAGLFAEITAEDYDSIDEDIRALKAAADDVVSGFAEVGASVEEHRSALVTMREAIEQFLIDMAKDIALEVTITATITVLASFVTFGIAAAGGAAVLAARVSHIVARYAPKIRPLIAVFKSTGLARRFTNVPDWSKHKQEMQRLLDLRTKNTTTRRHGLAPDVLDPKGREVLARGPSDSHGTDLNGVLRRGDTPTPDQQRQIDDLNRELTKLPKHEGPVVRHVNMTPEELAGLEPGKTWAEPGFMSTSNKPDGVSDVFANNRNVEMQIVSKNGRTYSDPDTGMPFGTDDEVLFPSNTQFVVHNKFYDPQTGRVVVQMIER
ncbi:hypothetical protein [Nocardia mangyaensis]|uniref:hypothetical protein n=1 Tax=Nocardia mangyaensis TaxID=2213200 RepID=UPI0026772DB5|nr:hypothetical protein [Nocardia mangyaensis]MDO3645881.1 hypothetical protein [Nocardia mangyaensis]